MVNLPMTSVAELRSHRIAIAACFAFRREISFSAFWDFFDSIDQKRNCQNYWNDGLWEPTRSLFKVTV
jgi:hypothetical protein